jgi:D-lactate dehydrogenase
MRVAIFSTKPYDRAALDAANAHGLHSPTYFEPRLDVTTASLAKGFAAVCVFVNDRVDAAAIRILADGGTRVIALRCAGFNNVDLTAAEERGIEVVRVPAYSPYAVAEFTIGLLLSLNRKIHHAYARVREDNFSLDGLLGHDMHGKTVGVVGTGRIGMLVARALKLGFGCDVLACDVVEDAALVDIGVRYVTMRALVEASDVISLHCPLTRDTLHLIDTVALAASKPGMLLINTSRGALVDTPALITALKSGQLGGVALDVYEQEEALFFEDLSLDVVQDDVFQRLLTFPNVLVTGHQAFFTAEAMASIAQTTLNSLSEADTGRALSCRIAAPAQITTE